MNPENIPSIGGETTKTKESFNPDEVREEIRQLKNLVIKNDSKKAEDRDPELAKYGHLRFLKDGDIDNIKEKQQLLLFKEIQNINPENLTEEEYEILSKKVSLIGKNDRSLGDEVKNHPNEAVEKAGHSIIPFLSSLLANKLYQTSFHKEKMKKA